MSHSRLRVTAALSLVAYVLLGLNCSARRTRSADGTTFQADTQTITIHGNPPVIACWVLRTNSTEDLSRSEYIKHSWGRYCNSIDFIDSSTPGIVADWFDVYDDLAAKSFRAWNFIYTKYLSAEKPHSPLVDFILKADADTYIIGTNLVEYLASFKNPAHRRYYIGKNFVDLNGNHFVAGTAIILSQAALRDMVHSSSPNCSFETFRARKAEDLALGVCLRDLNIQPHDTRDSTGAERFMVFGPDQMRVGGNDGNLPEWYLAFSQNKIMGKGCCSMKAIAFHYTTKEQLQHQTLVLRNGEWFWSPKSER